MFKSMKYMFTFVKLVKIINNLAHLFVRVFQLVYILNPNIQIESSKT